MVKKIWSNYLKWVKVQYDKRGLSQKVYDPEPCATNKITKEDASIEADGIERKSATDDFVTGCGGCGCGIVIFILFIRAVIWAWNIHWLFGILMFLFLIGLAS